MAEKKNSGSPAVSTNAGTVSDAAPKRTCGIVMPISAIGDEYSEEHWRRVRKILRRAIEDAGLQPQLVWENPEVDVIQSAILQNLYENDVVVCDLSGLNPNVMLETGLRLSTRRPTVIVTDRVHKPPFDVSTIGYVEYQRDLEYNATDDFISRLSKKISDVMLAADNLTYKSFVENFRFETVTPSVISVTSDEYIKEKIGELAASVARLERSQRAPSARAPNLRRSLTNLPPHAIPAVEIGRLVGKLDTLAASAAETEIDEDTADGVYCLVTEKAPGDFEFVIKALVDKDIDRTGSLVQAAQILRKHEDNTRKGLEER